VLKAADGIQVPLILAVATSSGQLVNKQAEHLGVVMLIRRILSLCVIDLEDVRDPDLVEELEEGSVDLLERAHEVDRVADAREEVKRLPSEPHSETDCFEVGEEGTISQEGVTVFRQRVDVSVTVNQPLARLASRHSVPWEIFRVLVPQSLKISVELDPVRVEVLRFLEREFINVDIVGDPVL